MASQFTALVYIVSYMLKIAGYGSQVHKRQDGGPD